MLSLKTRFQFVDLACRIASENHIVKATCHAAGSYLLQNGFKHDGFSIDDKHDIATIFHSFVYESVASLYTTGYFAYVIDRVNGKLRPRILPPYSYILVTPVSYAHLDFVPKTYYTVVLRNQEQCDLYRRNQPVSYILHPPHDSGRLNSAVLNLIDMHDAVIELLRLTLIHDAIRIRPKAWLTRQHKKDSPCYDFLDHTIDLPVEIRENTRPSIYSDMLNRNARLTEDRSSFSVDTFTKSILSRTIDSTADKDPSILIHAPPDFDLTQMNDTPIRPDLEPLIRLFDQRMCNSLGVPSAIIGLLQNSQASTSVPESVRAWQSSLVPFRNIINIALADVVAVSYTKIAVMQFKKTRDRKFLSPIYISLTPAVSLDTVLNLQPYLKPEEFAKIVSEITGLKPSDFSTAPMCWVMDQNSTPQKTIPAD